MINKKNLLGKSPFDLGTKDAIHVAIVSVRAGKPIKPGMRVGLNEFNEAVPNHKGPGVADPFLDVAIPTGMFFWLLLDQDEVPNVAHVWEHPSVKFGTPTRDVERNRWLLKYAELMGVTYEQLMEACAFVVRHGKAATYQGSKTADEAMQALKGDLYDVWSSWADESMHEFENLGTVCCPDWQYPTILFKY